jgi:hypothetical protein
MSSSEFSPNYSEANSTSPHKKKIVWILLAVGIISFILYTLTAFRTITWWDNSGYSTCAVSLGVPAPPGTLLPVLIGWLVTKIPLGLSSILKLNLLAGLAASVAIVLIGVCAIAINRRLVEVSESAEKSNARLFFLMGAAIAALSFAFSQTIWTYAIKFTPYIFSAMMTATILWAMIRWWQEAESENSIWWLFLITLLFGLDFSIHRTNILLLPAVFFWILLRKPKTIISGKSWLFGIGGLTIGLAFHLLTIFLAARHPYINFGDPSNLSRFWNYISLQQFGGGWLINIYPRNADLWDVQFRDYLNVFATNFFSANGILGFVGLLPVVIGIYGLIDIFRGNWRLAFALTILFLSASLGAVFYFNLPESYFRSIDRHYLPSLVIFAAIIAYGLGSFLVLLSKGRRLVAIMAITILILILPGYQLAKNYKQCDNSTNYFTIDFAANVIRTLPQNAIIFTNGDNDTYPLWYIQQVEKERPDIAIINLPLLNAPFYVNQLKARDPQFLSGLTAKEIDAFVPKRWRDSTVVLPAHGIASDFLLPDTLSLPDSIRLSVRPAFADSFLLAQEWLLLNIIIENNWQRPMYFAATVSPQYLQWLSPYLRFEGMAQRLMPLQNPPLNKDILRANLMQKYSYRGYASGQTQIEDVSRMMAFNLYSCFMQLAAAEMTDGNDSGCLAAKEKMLKMLPLERLGPLPDELSNAALGLCLKP